jgi:phosphoglucosamine mutase
LTELGADVITLHNKPNGYNINQDAGACHPNSLKQAVLSEKADVGIALDGDGDRIIMVDHLGNILDGDDIIYIILLGLIQPKLFSGGIVGTYMSNMGLEQAIKNLGINFIRTEVGDQNIIQALLEKGWLLGGEPSGHIIYLAVSTTGDGIIAALQVLQTMYNTGESLHSLKQGLKKYHQATINLSYSKNKIPLKNRVMAKIIKQAENDIKNKGRILVRYSGTEPVLRVMVECEEEKIANKMAKEVAEEFSSIIEN